MNTALEMMHFVEFAMLYVLIIAALGVNHRLTKVTSCLAALFSILYGVGDEFHQLFVPGRSFTLIDLVKDTVGVLIVWGTFHIFYFGSVKASRRVTNPVER
ncbi:VanZ family protein [Halobacillus halophilus]|uniref:VanZ family protein n=1 Tax=Halobacillus halophilus TaxID=1570 RepID=UPI001CD2E185|nr:VanZ family protein [Halobacillus halophilus]MCA1010654.1 VanZ family protein [Halobacillus halophilus]